MPHGVRHRIVRDREKQAPGHRWKRGLPTGLHHVRGDRGDGGERPCVCAEHFAKLASRSAGSNMSPLSIGCRRSHMDALDSACVALSLATCSSVRRAGRRDRRFDAEPDHVRGLSDRVMDGLGKLDALFMELPFPLNGHRPPDTLEPGDQVDHHHHSVHGGDPDEQRLLFLRIEFESLPERQAHGSIACCHHGHPQERLILDEVHTTANMPKAG